MFVCVAPSWFSFFYHQNVEFLLGCVHLIEPLHIWLTMFYFIWGTTKTCKKRNSELQRWKILYFYYLSFISTIVAPTEDIHQRNHQGFCLSVSTLSLWPSHWVDLCVCACRRVCVCVCEGARGCVCVWQQTEVCRKLSSFLQHFIFSDLILSTIRRSSCCTR